MRSPSHFTGLILAFALAIIWQLFNLGELTIPFISILALVYLVLANKYNKVQFNRPEGITTSILTALVLLIVLTTGGLFSPLFFLLYFIPFTICIMLTPESILIFLVGILFLFLPKAISDHIGENLIKIASVVLITPLAYFFGKEYRIIRQHERKDASIASTISNKAATILKDQVQNLPETDKKQLVDIIKESEKLSSE